MRLACGFLFVAALGLLAGRTSAQDKPAPKPPPFLKIDSTRVGFLSYDKNSRFYKPGMWSPVLVRLTAGDKPITDGKLIVETIDNEDVGTLVHSAVKLDAKEIRTFITYVRPGNISADIKIWVEADGKTFNAASQGIGALDLSGQLFLTLGGKMPELFSALVQMGGQRGEAFDDDPRATAPRFAAFEDDVRHLPDQWIGYQGVDLMILSTDNKVFLNALLERTNADRLKAIAQWVRRGGHLVVPMNWLQQGEISQVLQHGAWQPPVPVVLPADAGDVQASAVTHIEFQVLGGLNELTNPGGKGILLAPLQAAATQADWEVLVAAGEKGERRPVMTRMSYGLGSITMLAISLEQPPFTLWANKGKFWKALIDRLAPKVSQVQGQGQVNFNPGNQGQHSDISGDLYRDLDNFDVKVVPFGWVALFILLYIVVVGPLDYLLLKHVFHRLEWTWITFPTVVVAVSVAAYFTAYAIKGRDLKINQVDIVNFDLRTHLDAKGQPKKAYVYGQSFFTILSPRIQNYTVGLEPNAAFWGETPPKSPMSAADLSWFGPAGDNFNGVGRRGTQSFFRRPYAFASDAVGLEAVPIPVWTTKAFTACWEEPLTSLPFDVNLAYEQTGAEHKITGTIQNNLAVDFEDVWCLYLERAYKVGNGSLPGKKAAEVNVKLIHGSQVSHWAGLADDVDKSANDGDNEKSARPISDKAAYNPMPQIKKILFFDKVENNMRNHFLHHLDQTWRLRERKQGDLSLRDAILVGRVRFRSGPADSLVGDRDQPLPTLLWLGDLPGRPNVSRPSLIGTLNQDTYVRILVPVRPK